MQGWDRFQDDAAKFSPLPWCQIMFTPDQTWRWLSRFAMHNPNSTNSSWRDDIEMDINIDMVLGQWRRPRTPRAAQGSWRSFKGGTAEACKYTVSEPIYRTGYHRRYWRFHPDIVVGQAIRQHSSRPKLGHAMERGRLAA